MRRIARRTDGKKIRFSESERSHFTDWKRKNEMTTTRNENKIQNQKKNSFEKALHHVFTCTSNEMRNFSSVVFILSEFVVCFRFYFRFFFLCHFPLVFLIYSLAISSSPSSSGQKQSSRFKVFLWFSVCIYSSLMT